MATPMKRKWPAASGTRPVDPRPEKATRHNAISSIGQKLPENPLEVTESLVSIHRRFFDKLQQRHLPEITASHHDDAKIAKIEFLKRHRRALAAELRSVSQIRLATMGQRLREQRQDAALIERRPYLQGLLELDPINGRHHRRKPMIRHKAEAEAVSNTADTAQQVKREDSLLHCMQEYRNQIKIRAAYQLLGQTLLHQFDEDNDDIFALRIDVSVRGKYVACHHAFFQLVTFVALSSTGKRSTEISSAGTQLLQLQFKQHTLPACIDYVDSLQRHFGNSHALGPWRAGQIDFDTILAKLQAFSEDLHGPCHAFMVRKQVVEYLREKKRATGYSIRQVTTNPSHDSISFALRPVAASVMPFALRIELLYKESSSSLPTNVTVEKVRHAASRQSVLARAAMGRDGVVSSSSDDDDEEDDEVIKHRHIEALFGLAESAFRRLPVPEAVDAVVARAASG